MRVCAFMSVFNEEDVVEETVQKLIRSGLDVYIIDNGCTDQTVSKLQKYVGKGIIDIVHFISEEDGRRVFKLSDILEQFEIASRKLPHDWFMISDADEVKYGPWQHLSLNESIERVDRQGFNLINFKLFDFRPAAETQQTGEIETSLQWYSDADSASSIQMKCWKKSDAFDLKPFGGHIIQVPNPKLFPVRFINKHYPIRSIEHGMKKLKLERLPRYSSTELQRGWHSHYNAMNPDDAKSLAWQTKDLTFFDMEAETSKLFEECSELLLSNSVLWAMQSEQALEAAVITFATRDNLCSADRARELFQVGKRIYDISTGNQIPPIEVAREDMKIISATIASLRSQDYLNGQLLRFRNSGGIQLVAPGTKGA